jgi:hypothetical protein
MAGPNIVAGNNDRKKKLDAERAAERDRQAAETRQREEEEARRKAAAEQQERAEAETRERAARQAQDAEDAKAEAAARQRAQAATAEAQAAAAEAEEIHRRRAANGAAAPAAGSPQQQSGASTFEEALRKAYGPVLNEYVVSETILVDDMAATFRPQENFRDVKDGEPIRFIDNSTNNVFSVSPEEIEFKDGNGKFEFSDAMQMAKFAALDETMQKEGITLNGTRQERALMERAIEEVNKSLPKDSQLKVNNALGWRPSVPVARLLGGAMKGNVDLKQEADRAAYNYRSEGKGFFGRGEAKNTTDFRRASGETTGASVETIDAAISDAAISHDMPQHVESIKEAQTQQAPVDPQQAAAASSAQQLVPEEAVAEPKDTADAGPDSDAEQAPAEDKAAATAEAPPAEEKAEAEAAAPTSDAAQGDDSTAEDTSQESVEAVREAAQEEVADQVQALADKHGISVGEAKSVTNMVSTIAGLPENDKSTLAEGREAFSMEEIIDMVRNVKTAPEETKTEFFNLHEAYKDANASDGLKAAIEEVLNNRLNELSSAKLEPLLLTEEMRIDQDAPADDAEDGAAVNGATTNGVHTAEAADDDAIVIDEGDTGETATAKANGHDTSAEAPAASDGESRVNDTQFQRVVDQIKDQAATGERTLTLRTLREYAKAAGVDGDRGLAAKEIATRLVQDGMAERPDSNGSAVPRPLRLKEEFFSSFTQAASGQQREETVTQTRTRGGPARTNGASPS